MLQTIEVEIDASGHILPLEPLPPAKSRRAYLTLLPESPTAADITAPSRGSAAQALALLASPRFANRPIADPIEVLQRIENLRSDWTNEH
jgi:hypothetical protein